VTQGFVFGQPVTREGLFSQFVRDNFDALGTLNAGDTEPLNPQEGMPWLDTSQAPTKYIFKIFTGGSFQTAFEFPAAATAVSLIRIPITVAASTWNLVHNLGKDNVSVALFDLSNKVIEALDVDVSNVNQAVVTHAYPLTGSALVIG
jgi:hypothetical protein